MQGGKSLRKNCKDIDIDFAKVVDIFNKGGREAAREFVDKTYGIEYYLVARRIKNETAYSYNKGKRIYELKDADENQFLTLEEICRVEKNETEEKPIEHKICSTPFETILVDLMKDRMTELSKYVHIEQSSLKITINIASLKKSGYEVMIL